MGTSWEVLGPCTQTGLSMAPSHSRTFGDVGDTPWFYLVTFSLQEKGKQFPETVEALSSQSTPQSVSSQVKLCTVAEDI